MASLTMKSYEFTGGVFTREGGKGIGNMHFNCRIVPPTAIDEPYSWEGEWRAISRLEANPLGGEHEIRVSGQSVPIFFTTYTASRIAGDSTTEYGKFEGVGWPPKSIFPDGPDKPVPPTPDATPVKLVMSRYGAEDRHEFATLREALCFVAVCVDDNHAAPVSLKMPGTTFGGKPLKFDTHQLYAMAELVRER